MHPPQTQFTSNSSSILVCRPSLHALLQTRCLVKGRFASQKKGALHAKQCTQLKQTRTSSACIGTCMSLFPRKEKLLVMLSMTREVTLIE